MVKKSSLFSFLLSLFSFDVSGQYLPPTLEESWRWIIKIRTWLPKESLLIFDCAMCPGIFTSLYYYYPNFRIQVHNFISLYFVKNLSWVRYKTDLLEIHAENPTLHVLFVPGNPGRFLFIEMFIYLIFW